MVFKKGVSGNPKGKPPGTLSYSTMYKLAIEKLAKENGMKPIELEVRMYAAGLTKAGDGEYNFYKDTLDRIHGKAQEKVDITSKGEELKVKDDVYAAIIEREAARIKERGKQ